MTVKSSTKRGPGRPLKEVSNAMAAEKAILDYKTGIIGLMEKARNTLETLMSSASSSDKVKEGVAKFIIEEGKTMYQEYLAEDEEETPTASKTDKNSEEKPLTKPFTTSIIPFKKAE